jgi:hypothetical protein
MYLFFVKEAMNMMLIYPNPENNMPRPNFMRKMSAEEYLSMTPTMDIYKEPPKYSDEKRVPYKLPPYGTYYLYTDPYTMAKTRAAYPEFAKDLDRISDTLRRITDTTTSARTFLTNEMAMAIHEGFQTRKNWKLYTDKYIEDERRRSKSLDTYYSLDIGSLINSIEIRTKAFAASQLNLACQAPSPSPSPVRSP